MTTSSSLNETFEALTVILNNEAAFNTVVETFWESLDLNANGELSLDELEAFIGGISSDMGIKDPPNKEQVQHVFTHLDLNSDKSVSKDELEVFLRHLFKEQLKHAAEKLKVKL